MHLRVLNDQRLDKAKSGTRGLTKELRRSVPRGNVCLESDTSGRHPGWSGPQFRCQDFFGRPGRTGPGGKRRTGSVGRDRTGVVNVSWTEDRSP